MPKELLERLSGILDWWKIEDFTDRKEIEKELTSLMDNAYSQGWSDAKDGSQGEGEDGGRTAKSRRNCDVGTSTEQYERFRRFCYHYHHPGGGCYSRADDMDCPLRHKDGACTLNWAQLHYK